MMYCTCSIQNQYIGSREVIVNSSGNKAMIDCTCSLQNQYTGSGEVIVNSSGDKAKQANANIQIIFIDYFDAYTTSHENIVINQDHHYNMEMNINSCCNMYVDMNQNQHLTKLL